MTAMAFSAKRAAATIVGVFLVAGACVMMAGPGVLSGLRAEPARLLGEDGPPCCEKFEYVCGSSFPAGEWSYDGCAAAMGGKAYKVAGYCDSGVVKNLCPLGYVAAMTEMGIPDAYIDKTCTYTIPEKPDRRLGKEKDGPCSGIPCSEKYNWVMGEVCDGKDFLLEKCEFVFGVIMEKSEGEIAFYCGTMVPPLCGTEYGTAMTEKFCVGEAAACEMCAPYI